MGIVPVGVVAIVIVPVGVEVAPPLGGKDGLVGLLLLSEQAHGKSNAEKAIIRIKNFLMIGCDKGFLGLIGFYFTSIHLILHNWLEKTEYWL